ncbi:hypothetical protein HPB50_024633 [Hyalomma asiaticum]|uniref:Uncharacterized protein n=1 Tax=Hyalomma asiaticum TaxID=266040 RepID=A0ACB7SC10_HYAAI|nr:hypothetical protein HPB50_024633 [Hyalomma asiaticum]
MLIGSAGMKGQPELKKPKSKKKYRNEAQETSRDTTSDTTSETSTIPIRVAAKPKRLSVGMESWRQMSGTRVAPISLRTDEEDDGDDDDRSELPVKPYMKLIPAAVIVFMVVTSTTAVVVFATLQNGTPARESGMQSQLPESDSRSATDPSLPLLTPEANDGYFKVVNASVNEAGGPSIGTDEAEPWSQK